MCRFVDESLILCNSFLIWYVQALLTGSCIKLSAFVSLTTGVQFGLLFVQEIDLVGDLQFLGKKELEASFMDRAKSFSVSADGRREAWATIFIALLVIASSIWLWLYRVFQKGQRTPGPVIWPVLGTGLEMKRNYHRLNDWYLDYFSEETKSWKLRLPFPLGQTFIATVDPVVVEYILTNIHKYGKGNLKDRLGDFLGSGIFLSDGEAWRRHRRIASTEFSTRKLREHSNSVFREGACQLANILKKAMAAGEPVEFQSLALRMTLDSICKVAFGVDLGCLSPTLPEVPFGLAFDEAQSIITQRQVNPFFKLHRALDIGTERRFRKAIDEVNEFAKDVITKRRVEITAAHEEGKEFKKVDLLSKFMDHRNGAEDSYSDKELRDVIVDFLLAGRDTTAVTLAWFLQEMCCHPEIADNIYTEGAELVGKHSNFEAMAEQLTHETLGKMHYLHAALTECLRLHPPVPKTTKEVLVDDVLPDGTKVKKQNIVQFNEYCMGRMPFIWGSDVLEFKPQRWLKDGVFHTVSNFQFSVFQGGPRICLGRDSAYLQLKLTLALLNHFFIFKLVLGQEITYGSTFVMPIKNGICVTLSPR